MASDDDNDRANGSSSSADDAFFAELARAPDVTPMSMLVGTTLGRYAIASIVGRGGMGIVYRARDTVLDREVALKLVPPEMLSDPERRARFVREARSGAAANHPNIAAVYDVGEIDGKVFLAMELVEGQSLRARLASGPLSAEDACQIAKGVARGLAKAHEKGIIHRDLKPDNVMVGEGLHVKLLDFGLAKLRAEDGPLIRQSAGGALGRSSSDGSLTYEGRVLGTPAYMSPEQARGRTVDPRSDLFSFGVVCHEMLAGERPFKGDSAIEILSAVMRDPPPALPASVPPRLRAIVERCLEKDPERRYPTAKALLADLDGTGDLRSSPSVTDVTDAAPSASTVPSAPGAVGAATWKRWLLPATALAAIAAAIALTRGDAKTTPATIATAVARDAGAGRAITDYKPKSNNPEALVAYASALQNVRDGSIAFGSQEMQRAAGLDPAFAAAHLRALLFGTYKLEATKAREHYAAASQHRSVLDERDVAILQASEELIRERPNRRALAQAMAQVAERFPNDAEVAWIAASMLGAAGRQAEAKTAIRRARELDPAFAAALWLEASMMQDDDGDSAVRLLDECLRMSPAAASCLRIRSSIRASRGDCSGFESDARRMTEIEPLGPRAYEFLAAALAAKGAPLESVKATLSKRASLAAPGSREAIEMKAQSELWVALLEGDFPAAEAAALALEKLNANEPSELSHVASTLTLIDIYDERGEPERALAVGEAFMKHLPAWTANSPWGVRARLVALRRRLGKIDDAAAKTERAALIREASESTPETDSKAATYSRLSIETQYVTTAEEARYSLDQLTAPSVSLRGIDQWARGKAELLVGNKGAALTSLRRALSTCAAMPTTDDPFGRMPFVWAEAQLLLAEAIEEDDRAGACDAYARVIDRWKSARPRSVSVEKARTRARARGCVHS